MHKQWCLVFAGVLFLMTGCSGPDDVDETPDAAPAPQTLIGEVFYRERKYLPPGAELHITLKEVSKVGASSTVVAESTTLLAGSQPYQFTLDYSPADIDAREQYTLHASITFYGELLFTSATRTDPFEKPEEKIAIRVTTIGPPEP